MARIESLVQNRTALTVIVFAVIAAMVAYKMVQTKPFLGYSTAQHLQLAQDLIRAKPLKPQLRNKERFISGAGYPLVIAALASFDHTLESGLHCQIRDVACDPSTFQGLFALQYGVALVGLIAIFLLAWVLSRSWGVALLTFILAFIAGSYGGLAGQLSPLIWLQTLMLLFLLFIALAATRDEMKWTFAAGLALGCGALFSSQILIVGIVSAISLLLIGRSRHLNLKHSLGHAGTLAIGAGGVAIAASAVLHAQELTSLLWQHFAHAASERIDGPSDMLSYLIATPGIFMRGLWVGTPILSVLGLIHLPSLLKFSREDARLGPTLLVAIPILSLVVINTLVTANRPEYNVGLVFLLCYATAYLIGRTDVRRMFWADKDRSEEQSQPL